MAELNPDEDLTLIEDEFVTELATLDATLGYFSRRLKDADRKDPFVRGYQQAHSDVAHIRSVLWFDMYRRHPEIAKRHKTDWDAIHNMPDLGTHRIKPTNKD